MPDLILHHYALSPFSAKVRAMLGSAQLSWRSAVTREFPPRPVLAQLAGGYRRIPVAQIGADIFCDSKVIAEEIAALSGHAALSLEHCSDEVRAYAREVDLKIFLACMMSAGGASLLRTMGSSMNPFDLLRALWDRVQIGRKSSVKLGDLGRPRQRVLAHLAGVEQRLRQHPFLFGAEPNHADFSTYHSLWFMRDLGASSLIDPFPETIAWMERIKAFGEGQREEISPDETLAVAKGASPRPILDEHRADPSIGRPVRIGPADYAQGRTAGTLVGATASRWILAREPAGLGTLHVHFPRTGYELLPA
ncbi:glutathione S-transferase family protein [Oleomonas cavernae]|uniref:Glutathione S-transferase family protein n=1 Tax=Oleomonas cavernae TaxID=2320859 RepID=A0A418W8F8_9PROT|nr:glutathione S-transferase family protein [Oleomonas cavernae]RJF86284.1 glutathione S-transferase family protein [Oleomonas cavernae]